jgi:hypothetical protein
MVNVPVLPLILSKLISEYLNDEDRKYILDIMRDDMKYNYASKNGYLDLLSHFRGERGFWWNKDTCEYAASNGYL